MIDDKLARPSLDRPSDLAASLVDSFPASDAVLMCSFGLDDATIRTGAQLRAALIEAGYRACVARHLVRISPLLRRLPRGDYQLRRFGD